MKKQDHLGIESPRIPDIPLQRLRTKFRVDCLVLKAMDIHYMLRDIQIRLRVTLIQHHKEQIKATHNWRAHLQICPERLLPIVPPPNRVCRSEDGRACIERGVDTGFGNRNCLLFHRFVDGDLVANIHLIKFVNGADAVVRKHQGTGLNGEVACFFVFHDGGC